MEDPRTDPVHVHDQEADCDACLCDIAMQDTEATLDAELPVAAGGLQPGRGSFDDEDAVDGCDVAFDPATLTQDAELPAATGGGA